MPEVLPTPPGGCAEHQRSQQARSRRQALGGAFGVETGLAPNGRPDTWIDDAEREFARCRQSSGAARSADIHLIGQLVSATFATTGRLGIAAPPTIANYRRANGPRLHDTTELEG